MSQENQSSLRFSLEESLWFRKGQEVEELVSISLDPDITIQENDQYVTIRGSLELSGEYRSHVVSNQTNEDAFSSQKFVERVEEREQGICEFSHRFPVDITIPNNRIQSIYDIDVLVETFDYSLPERSCLKLSAELTISGLYGSEQQQEEKATVETAPRTETVEEEPEEITIEQAPVASTVNNNFLFEAEARKQQEEPTEEVALPNFPTFNYEPPKQEETEDAVEPAPAVHFQEARSEGHHQAQQVEVEVEQEVMVVEEQPQVVLVEEEVVVEVEEESSSSSSSSEEAPKQAKKKLFGKKKSMSLTEFFARKDEGSSQVKLRVCIVQKGDTVESLADRYDVTVPNLLRTNNMELSQDVFEGQVLYIPAAFAKN